MTVMLCFLFKKVVILPVCHAWGLKPVRLTWFLCLSLAQVLTKEKEQRSRKDLESMTEKSQAVVRLNAQLMTQVKQLKASSGGGSA